MTSVSPNAGVGPRLREWRRRRRVSQLELALDSGVSARHISFVETGRSKPGREMLLRVLGRLDVPFRERNQMLLAAGHAPAFSERSLDDQDLASVREALDLILSRHEPYPAVVVDRAWNVVAANAAATSWIAFAGVDPALLEPPANAVRIGLHPRGLAPLIVDLAAWRAFWRERLERQLAITRDPGLAALVEELDGYPLPPDEPESSIPRGAGLPGPLRLRAPDGRELTFLGVFATIDTPFEVTTSELAIELIFPADRASAEALQALARESRDTGDER
jgi:transcriptional regulator with XRE-family HTH domain